MTSQGPLPTPTPCSNAPMPVNSQNAGAPLLNLRILRGPLAPHQEQTILGEFNRLTRSAIPLDDFRRWVCDPPEGPACHAILETDDGRIVGHFCLIPLGAHYNGRRITAARTEYFFVHEDFRSRPVRGFHNPLSSCAILLLNQLYRHCTELGWGPCIVSASEKIQPFHRLAGCKPLDLPLYECLLVLSPWSAAKLTPNLETRQRTALFLSGLAQAAISHALRAFKTQDAVAPVSIAGLQMPRGSNRIAFFDDRNSLLWRYPQGQYTPYVRQSDPQSYLITKHGSRDRYLRVCQWHLASNADLLPILAPLIDQARSQRALGLRWSVYLAPGDESDADFANVSSLLRSLRRFGFMCVRRNRRLLIYSRDKTFLSPSAWEITDSFFTFDL
jgi:hypothetical protein